MSGGTHVRMGCFLILNMAIARYSIRDQLGWLSKNKGDVTQSLRVDALHVQMCIGQRKLARSHRHMCKAVRRTHLPNQGTAKRFWVE